MEKTHRYITYALKDDEIVSIDDVERGLECGCVCPACKEKLIAKKGDERVHHFAHASGTECERGYETSLHLMAKEILSKASKMWLPAIYIVEREVFPAKEITIETVELEKRVDDIIPDIVVHTNEGDFIVEIYVTHRVDDDKLQKIKKIDMSAIEINLSELDEPISKDNFKSLLMRNSKHKYWLYCKSDYLIECETKNVKNIYEQIRSKMEIVLPETCLRFSSGKEPIKIKESYKISIDYIELKNRYRKIPSIYVISNGQPLYIEMCSVTSIDTNTVSKIEKEGISTIVIERGKQKWLYNKKVDALWKAFLSTAENKDKDIYVYGKFIKQFGVDNCPLAKRKWHDKIYANLEYDCYSCQYCIMTGPVNYYDYWYVDDENDRPLLCTGKKRVATIQDLYKQGYLKK